MRKAEKTDCNYINVHGLCDLGKKCEGCEFYKKYDPEAFKASQEDMDWCKAFFGMEMA